MDVDPHGTDFSTFAAEAGCVRQVLELFHALQMGRNQRADRALIGSLVSMTADILVNRTNIQARATADTV